MASTQVLEEWDLVLTRERGGGTEPLKSGSPSLGRHLFIECLKMNGPKCLICTGKRKQGAYPELRCITGTVGDTHKSHTGENRCGQSLQPIQTAELQTHPVSYK